ncbi:MAG: hypothetical protein XU08_C0003G0087 [candidate division WWE3 bacterium CSP1-7]|uniref:Uncharacterized protein n=1 Tax=candidate division WWE3 bacterium CSP1-7 TaxID=1576480 RepID=A0A0T5ZX82_UNCKA|nr:MAG: hypothetical protein XU08_C0003G0087 [candidate division WWE3 bacterium CSP1-7]
MNLLRIVRRWLKLPERLVAKRARRPKYMWEILNMILPEEHPRRRWRENPYDQLANKRVSEIFPPES